MPDDFDPIVERERMDQRMRDWEAMHPQEKRTPTIYASGASESIGENLKSCAYMIVGIVIAVIVIALIVNFIIIHGWWPIP